MPVPADDLLAEKALQARQPGASLERVVHDVVLLYRIAYSTWRRCGECRCRRGEKRRVRRREGGDADWHGGGVGGRVVVVYETPAGALRSLQ